MLKRVIECLRFDAPSLEVTDWDGLLAAADRAYLTPALVARWRSQMPTAALATAEKNAERHRRTVAVCGELAAKLAADGIGFVFLKGLTQWPWYCDDAADRPQFDVDIYCPDGGCGQAQASLTELGFEALGAAAGLATDHSPPLIRRTAWRWRDDLYDTEMPLTVELHHSLWNEAHWGFVPGDWRGWWARRTVRSVAGLSLPALDPCDGLAYSSWHLLRHLLNGDLRPYHAYELAHFLERSASEDGFWAEWQARYPGRECTAAAIAFRVARDTFGCALHPVAASAVAALPGDVKRWFALFGEAALGGGKRGNKDALLLHLCLVRDRAQRWKIAGRKLAPLRLPPGFLYDDNPVIRRGFQYGLRVLTRTGHHVSAMASLVGSAARWSWAASSSKSQTSR